MTGSLLLLSLVYMIIWWAGRLIAAPLGIESNVLTLFLGAVLLVGVGGTMGFLWLRNRYRRLHAIRLADIDHMPGLEFEAYVCKLMAHQGYGNVRNVRGSGDFGVDIIAERSGVRYAVQVKRYKSGVSRRAISDAVAGKYHFECDVAMVVTNSHFTRSAKVLAESTQCLLVDRDQLSDWIVAFQRG